MQKPLPKTLSKIEIEYLYKFCIKHYVRDYDAQIEIVDHLANTIEAIWQKNPNISFENALDESFKSFGFKGFSTIVATKTKAMEKQHFSAKKEIFISLFTWPKAIFTLMLFTIIASMPVFFSLTLLKILLAIALFVGIIIEFYCIALLHKRNKLQVKQMLLTNNVYYIASTPMFSYLFLHFDKIFGNSFNHNHFYLFAAFNCIILISFYITYNYSNSVIAKAKQLYPLAFKEA